MKMFLRRCGGLIGKTPRTKRIKVQLADSKGRIIKIPFWLFVPDAIDGLNFEQKHKPEKRLVPDSLRAKEVKEIKQLENVCKPGNETREQRKKREDWVNEISDRELEARENNKDVAWTEDEQKVVDILVRMRKRFEEETVKANKRYDFDIAQNKYDIGLVELYTGQPVPNDLRNDPYFFGELLYHVLAFDRRIKKADAMKAIKELRRKRNEEFRRVKINV